MPKAKPKSIRATMSISLPPSLKEWVQARATKNERYDSEVIREAVEYYKAFIEGEAK